MPINFSALQTRLAPLYTGAIDGKPGMRTYSALLAKVGGQARVADLMLQLGGGMATHLPAYGIDASAPRLAAFLGQCCHESGGWRYMREIWGPTETQQRYEGRRDLGNNQPGDGHRFMGRGMIQITGRANYADMGHRLDLDLTGNPALAEQPDTAVWTACQFWKSRGLNDLADRGDTVGITRRINGGTNGLAERTNLTARANLLLGGQ
jgi:putative chitinase